LELALEDLLVAVAEEDDAPIDEGLDEPAPDEVSAPTLRRRPRVSDATLRERRELDPGTCCPDCGGDLRVVGEDVSELLDMIAAQMKVIQIARIKKSCRRCEKMVQEPAPSRRLAGKPSTGRFSSSASPPAAWQVRTCWRMCWSPNLMTTFPFIASTRSLPAWARFVGKSIPRIDF